METSSIAAVEALFDEVAGRFGVSHLTAYMVVQVMEAVVPLAPDYAKSHAMMQVNQMEGRVGKRELIELVRYLAGTCWCTSQDIVDGCEKEIRRVQLAAAAHPNPMAAATTANESTGSHVGGLYSKAQPLIPSLSVNDDLRVELQRREQLIREQGARIEALEQQQRATTTVTTVNNNLGGEGGGSGMKGGASNDGAAVGGVAVGGSVSPLPASVLRQAADRIQRAADSANAGSAPPTRESVVASARSLAAESRRYGRIGVVVPDTAEKTPTPTPRTAAAQQHNPSPSFHEVIGGGAGGTTSRFRTPEVPQQLFGFGSPRNAQEPRTPIVLSSSSNNNPVSSASVTDTLLPSQMALSPDRVREILTGTPKLGSRQRQEQEVAAARAGWDTSSFTDPNAAGYAVLHNAARMNSVYHMFDLQKRQTARGQALHTNANWSFLHQGGTLQQPQQQ